MAGLTLFTGNRLEHLATALAEQWRRQPLPPLTREVVMVQSRGMERWLNLQMADHLNISANLECVFPRSFVTTLFQTVLAAPGADLFSAESLTWTILKVLPEIIDTPPLAPLRRYLDHDDDGLKRFQLAEQVAAIMERYLILRPDMIRDWDAGGETVAEGFDNQQWQPLLWRRIRDELPEEAAGSHPAALHDRLLRDTGSLPGLPERLTVFGISTLAPFYIDILLRLSRQIEVDVYYLNPCREYWEYVYSQKELHRLADRGLTDEAVDLAVGNSLLASMGAAGREFFSLLLNTVEDTGLELFADPGRDSLLAAVQADILNLVDGDERPPVAVAPDDGSIQIHACHTPMREVEVLYDQLLALFDRQADTQPRDIVVMMPDVSRYAPLIRAVFDSPGDPARRIPYSIADSSLKTVNSVAAPLLRIIDLPRNRYRAPEMMELLETAMIRRRFGITETDLDTIKNWVAEAGICWGINGAYRESLGLPGFYENTWQFGLDRLLMGYALPVDSRRRMADPLFAGILPAGGVEGAEARLLGSFANFAETVFATGRELEASRPVDQWIGLWRRILDDFFETAGDAEERDLVELREMLARQEESGGAVAAGFQEPVSPVVGRYHLENILATNPRGTGFLSAGVTFGTLLPMRSIPFKVICLIGMNDGDYPRITRPPGFDLVEKKRRLGDFSKRNEDRYLFLESLLSAREKLIISYVGQDIRDNSVIPPSPVVNELLDYIKNGFVSGIGDEPATGLTIRHPLQPFSPRYFSGEDRLFSYSEHNFRAAVAGQTGDPGQRRFCGSELPPAGEAERPRPTLENLAAFFRNPTAFFLQNRLRLSLSPEESGRPPDREPFTTGSLEQYLIRETILEEYLNDRDETTARRVLTASGKLPHGTPGEIEWRQYHRQVSRFASDLRRLMGGEAAPPRPMVLRLGHDDSLTVSGTLSRVYPTGQLFYRCAGLKARDIIKAWIYHLAYNAGGGEQEQGRTHLAGWNRVIGFSPLESEEAGAELRQLLELFHRGWQSPLPFFPESALAYAEKAASGNTRGALTAARGCWQTGWHQRGESDDPWIRRCFDGDMPAEENFQQTARALFEPLLAALTGVDPAEFPS
ncbi:MAG: exodeoxyribonuclease V subunit gamma [Desulfosudaceae bacterium]